jgi:adenylylsulfate kinase
MSSDPPSAPSPACKVVWFFGLPSSGKTTLATALRERLESMGQKCAALDGDQLRKGLCSDLRYAEADRHENLRRAAEVAKLMVGLDVYVIASFITPLKEYRAMVRDVIGMAQFRAVFVRCPLSECQARDVKGLYRKAADGLMQGMTGVDAPFEVPDDEAVITVDSKGTSVDDCVDLIVQALRES